MALKHSIYTVLNSAYMEFGKILIQSYLKHNIDSCKYIFIVDTGLLDSDKKWLTQFNQVHILNSGMSVPEFTGQNSAEWTATVVSKTAGAYFVLNSFDDIGPLVMIDSDCLVIDDLSTIINLEYDMQICHRHGHQTPLLGSFVSFNKKEACLDFLKIWIDTIPSIKTPWKESPALSLVYKQYKDNFKIELVPENIVSCMDIDTLDASVKVIHFKAGSIHKTIEESIQKRIYDRGWGDIINKYIN